MHGQKVTFQGPESAKEVLVSDFYEGFSIRGVDTDGFEYRFYARMPLLHEGFHPSIDTSPLEVMRATYDSLGMLDTRIIAGSGVQSFQEVRMADLPLLSRAWVFQERLLSRRVIHFAPFEMFWECQSKLKCECGELTGEHRNNLHSKSERENPTAKKAYRALLQEASQDHHILRTFPLLQSKSLAWQMMIRHYTRLDLTRETDRLPALSGIACKSQGNGLYLAGMWADDFPPALLWFPDVFVEKIARSLDSAVPSWSWASVQGPIEYYATRGFHEAQVEAALIASHCEAAGRDPRRASEARTDYRGSSRSGGTHQDH